MGGAYPGSGSVRRCDWTVQAKNPLHGHGRSANQKPASQTMRAEPRPPEQTSSQVLVGVMTALANGHWHLEGQLFTGPLQPEDPPTQVHAAL